MDFDFSHLNLQYLMHARDIARHDPEVAVVLLGISAKLVHMLAELKPEQMSHLTQVKFPLLVPRDEPVWWSRVFRAIREGRSVEIRAVLEHISLIAAP